MYRGGEAASTQTCREWVLPLRLHRTFGARSVRIVDAKLFVMHWIICLIAAIVFAGCSRSGVDVPGAAPSSLSEVPAVRLNYRYEADVPPPDPSKDPAREERNPSVQADFDANRAQEVLDKTLTSPDGKRVLAVYHKAGDLPSEFRLDMYTADGRILKKVTSETMAVHFPDTIRWSPDSSTVAFVAMIRGASVDETAEAPADDPEVSVAQPGGNANSAPAADVSAHRPCPPALARP